MADHLQLLCSSSKLERDRGVLQLQGFLKNADDNAVKSIELNLLQLLNDNDSRWETKHGSLMGVKTLLQQKKYSQDFCCAINAVVLRYLEDNEFRVRIASGEVLGVLSAVLGASVYQSAKDTILEGVRSNMERQSIEEAGVAEHKLAESIKHAIADEDPETRRLIIDAQQIFHDTAGWKSLETYMKCLQSVIEGCGTSFNKFIDPELIDLISQTLHHPNRFVRETGYYVCASIVKCNHPDGVTVCSPEDNEVYKNGQLFAEQLAEGLADNWSQVRLASSVATRMFLQGLNSEMRSEFFPLLLPPMCMNRYYVAEGVRTYNQETWREVTHGEGKQLLEQHIHQVVEFYIGQTEADNHAVREAACACIAELASKIDKDVVRPFVARLLDALLVCFKDDSWPVRDASCVACGNFVLCFPEESRSTMVALYPLFFENLEDNILSVRQGAALALANVIRAYGNEAMEIVANKIKEGLEGVKKQPANSEKYSELDKSPATYGVVKRLRDNDEELHTDKQMYSCGSLAPKMHKGKRGGGCMDHQFRKPSEPWELGDGCIYMLGEMAQIPSATQEVQKQLPRLAEASSHQHYTQHVHLLESLCKQMPYIAKGLGKKTFKMYLEIFLDPIFYSMCDNALTTSAANQCINALSTFLGPNILKGRVEMFNPRYMDLLSSVQFMAPF